MPTSPTHHDYEHSPPLLSPRSPIPTPIFGCHYRRLTVTFIVILLLVTAAVVLWPTKPDLHIVRLRLDGVRLDGLSLYVSLAVRVKIWNPDFFSLDYRSIVVSVAYRGQQLGLVNSAGGSVGARGVSVVDAEVEIDGTAVIQDAVYLIQDWAQGSIPFDTVTEVQGVLHFLFLDLPIQGEISCLVNVHPENQTVTKQNC